MAKIKAIVFDYDGVIVDSFPIVHTIYHRICAQFGKHCPLDFQDFKKVYGVSSQKFLTESGFTDEEKNQANLLFKKLILEHTPPFFPDIAEVIEVLAKTHTLFVVTANHMEEVVAKMNALGVVHCFKEIIGSQLAGPMKKVDPLKALLQNYHYASEEVVMIGDRDPDYIHAKEAGFLHVILVDYGWGYSKDKYPQKIPIKKPKDIVKAIAALER
ncbi:HAD family hydrolase [Candidatus Woesearchaeota archaeon]|nr:MAG: HAD family hydrolase [Candidatus Woesearchaeota archaeon]